MDNFINYGFGAVAGAYSQYAESKQDCFGGAWQVGQSLVDFAQYRVYSFTEWYIWLSYLIDLATFAFNLVFSLQTCGYSISLSAHRDQNLSSIDLNQSDWISKFTKKMPIKFVKAQSKLIPDSIASILKPIFLVLDGVSIFTQFFMGEYPYFKTKHLTSTVTGTLLYLQSLSA
eukprot:403371368